MKGCNFGITFPQLREYLERFGSGMWLKVMGDLGITKFKVVDSSIKNPQYGLVCLKLGQTTLALFQPDRLKAEGLPQPPQAHLGA